MWYQVLWNNQAAAFGDANLANRPTELTGCPNNTTGIVGVSIGAVHGHLGNRVLSCQRLAACFVVHIESDTKNGAGD